MDLVYFGSGAFGLPTLGSLARTHTIKAIITQPDRPAGRGGAVTPTPVAGWAAQHLRDVPRLKPVNVNEAAMVERIRAFPAAAWVIIAFGQKLGRTLLESRFAMNLHASLLPRWRGAAPINAAILAGDVETGNSVITLADRMDAGLILGQSRRPMDPMQTAGDLHDALAADGPALVEQILGDHSSGKLAPRRQDESRVTLAPKLSKADSWVDLAQPAETCRRRVHGLTPWPGVALLFRGEPLKVLRVRPLQSDAPVPPGTLIDGASGAIACAPGSSLQLLEVQPAGKRAMAWSEYARGHHPRTGETLAGRFGTGT